MANVWIRQKDDRGALLILRYDGTKAWSGRVMQAGRFLRDGTAGAQEADACTCVLSPQD